jgi:hypothetical protein
MTNFHNIYFLEKKIRYLFELCHCHKEYIPHSMILQKKSMEVNLEIYIACAPTDKNKPKL